MTRRIAIAILLTTWATLLVIGAAVYLTARQVLLSDLDDSILSRVTALTHTIGAVDNPAAARSSATPEGDRFIISDAAGRTIARPTTAPAGILPVVIRRAFTSVADGQRFRTLTFTIHPANAGVTDADYSVVYSQPATQFDHLLNRLMMWLVIVSICCGIIAGTAAIIISRVMLKPLRETAGIVGEIDESHLDRRIEVSSLPPELQPMASRLNEMLDRLQQSFNQRRQFIAAASHELRTPVAAMLATLEIALRRDRPEESLVESMKLCLTDARAMHQLVNGLMRQAKSETAQPNEEFNLSAMIDDLLNTGLRSITDKAIDVRKEYASDISLFSQPQRVRSILSNLINNAIEYCNDGGQVKVVGELIGQDLLVHVSDTGPGIPADFVSKIFEPFSRGDKKSNDGHLGLGLSMVRAHVTALKGRCEVETIPGHGTTFFVFLPKVHVNFPGS